MPNRDRQKQSHQNCTSDKQFMYKHTLTTMHFSFSALHSYRLTLFILMTCDILFHQLSFSYCFVHVQKLSTLSGSLLSAASFFSSCLLLWENRRPECTAALRYHSLPSSLSGVSLTFSPFLSPITVPLTLFFISKCKFHLNLHFAFLYLLLPFL